MKRPGKLGTVFGAIALTIAIVGLTLASVSAAPDQSPSQPEKAAGQSVSLRGF